MLLGCTRGGQRGGARASGRPRPAAREPGVSTPIPQPLVEGSPWQHCALARLGTETPKGVWAGRGHVTAPSSDNSICIPSWIKLVLRLVFCPSSRVNCSLQINPGKIGANYMHSTGNTTVTNPWTSNFTPHHLGFITL